MGIQRFLEERILRHQAFFEDNEPGQILAVISPYTYVDCGKSGGGKGSSSFYP